MLCQECEKRPATLHFTKILNGEKTEFHLCEVCAGEKGDMLSLPTAKFSIHHLLTGLLNLDAHSSSLGGMTKELPLRCDSCGLTYSQFSKSGRFGCVDCYQHFSDKLDPLFRRIHGSMEHGGKVPQRSGGVIKLKKELNHLKYLLQEKIATEEFEEAASIRDQIKQLEKQIANS
ncbi:MAG TPA: UvrB/UvrC motif-containing protein [Bacillota bacterium]|nr:UvrB/UvrC motif-containing protein [Bacillota bacterium]